MKRKNKLLKADMATVEKKQSKCILDKDYKFTENFVKV
jgi:hypothetical protein